MVRQKYVFNKHGTYHYQRDYPTKLKHLAQKKTFTYPLQLKVTEASDLEIQKAAITAEEAYQRQLLLISNSDPDALSATDLEKAAADYLKEAWPSGRSVCKGGKRRRCINKGRRAAEAAAS